MVASYQGDQIYVFDLLGRPHQSLGQGQEGCGFAVESSSLASSLNSSSASPSSPSSQSLFGLGLGLSPAARMTGDESAAHSRGANSQGRTSKRTGTGTGTGGATIGGTSGYDEVGPTHCLGGHINYATFLKNVSFFGPHDEYVVSGSDSGHLWVWETASGLLATRPRQDNLGE